MCYCTPWICEGRQVTACKLMLYFLLVYVVATTAAHVTWCALTTALSSWNLQPKCNLSSLGLVGCCFLACEIACMRTYYSQIRLICRASSAKEPLGVSIEKTRRDVIIFLRSAWLICTLPSSQKSGINDDTRFLNKILRLSSPLISVGFVDYGRHPASRT